MRFPTAVLAVNTVGLALSFLAVNLRLWSRYMRRVKLKLSDYTIIVSWVCGFRRGYTFSFTDSVI